MILRITDNNNLSLHVSTPRRWWQFYKPRFSETMLAAVPYELKKDDMVNLQRNQRRPVGSDMKPLEEWQVIVNDEIAMKWTDWSRNRLA